MASIANRSSIIGVARQPKRPVTSRDGIGGKQQLWIPMLQSASKGKDLPEKHLIVLGGSSDQQREFLEQLNPESLRRRNDRRQGRTTRTTDIPLSNKYALGYTYHDILDADQEDVLARLNVHMLTKPSGRYVPLLNPLFSSKTVKDTLIVILLDWGEPFLWARQLRQWMRLLRKVIFSLDEESKIQLEECMNSWKQKRIGPEAQTSISQEQTIIPPGPGEWDEGLGVPLAVACVQSEKIEMLEKEMGWGDDHFDFLQQWLRTVLLKHGASLVYTATFDANSLRPLLHSSLSIQSLLKKEVIKHNIIDRDKILVPPNWDSWGKIRIIKEGFDPEEVSNAWSVEIQEEPEDTIDLTPPKPDDIRSISDPSQSSQSAVSMFESSLPNPAETSTTTRNAANDTEITVIATPLQDFLQAQLPILEKYQAEDREAQAKAVNNSTADRTINSTSSYRNTPILSPTSQDRSATIDYLTSRSGAVSPSKHNFSVNVNGIDIDAEEATRRLREREAERQATSSSLDHGINTTSRISGTSTPTFSRTRTGGALTTHDSGTGGGPAPSSSTPSADGKEPTTNQELRSFFGNLINKGPSRGGGSDRGSRGLGAVGSGANSPGPVRRDSAAPPSSTG